MNISLCKKYLCVVILIAVFAVLIHLLLFSTSNFYQSTRWKALDFLCSVQRILFSSPQENNQISIIAIDDESLKRSQMSWPWGRDVFAEIIKKLNSLSPRLIFINFTFAGEGRDKEDDLLLSVAIGEAKNIILPSYYDSNMELTLPLKEFSSFAKKVGFINKINDVDGVVRRFYPFHKDDSGVTDNYAVELTILGSLLNKDEESIISEIPLLRDGSVYINYFFKPEDFNNFSLADIIANNIDPNLLKDKVVLLGSTTEITHDIYPTPPGNMSGIYMIANSLITLMSGKFLIEVNYLISLSILIAFVLFTGITTFRYGIGRSILTVALCSVLFFIISVYSFRHGLILDWFSPFFIMILTSVSIAFYRYITILKINMEDLRKANIEIKNAQKEIVRREQLSTIGKLTSKIIHELNNPIGNIKDHIEMLSKKIKEPGDIQKILDLAYKEVVRAKKIGEELKTSYTPHVEERIPSDINKLLLDIVETSRQGAASKGIEIQLNLNERLPLVPVSPDKIKQVFLNMLLNAIDATGSGRHIYISTSQIGADWIDIVFKDEGCGIPKEDLNKIFDAFYTTKKHKKGSGLGLFISDEIIKAHKGRISVESSAGAGTTFTIRLPAKE